MFGKTSILVFAFIKLTIGDDVIVQLPTGKVRGREDVTYENKTIYIFQQIPYASPPVGNLRFKAPQPHEGWDGVFESTPVTCFQISSYRIANESEDCLFVNIYTPMLPNKDKNVSLPVYFFIHGGCYIEGSGGLFKGDRFVGQDIVFVSINYRLGVFGFLSTGDEVIPGNNGLKDQQLALKWTYENIHLFGGDPNQITIGGQSAGSASVAYQLLNHNNRNFIAGAILESGSAIIPSAYQRRAKEITFAFASLLNSSFETNKNTQDLLEFLLNCEATDIAKAAVLYHQYVSTNVEYLEVSTGCLWAPVIEVKNPDAFITKKMFKLIEAENVLPVPILIGINSEEVLVFFNETFLKYIMEQYDAHLDWLVPKDMAISDQQERIRIGTTIRDLYTEGEPLLDRIGDGVRYLSDTSFTRSIIKHAELVSRISKTYFYQFSYRGTLPGNPPEYDGAENVAHGEELFYIYMFCLSETCDLSSAPEADQIASQRLVKLWSNFVKYQNPTPASIDLLQNVTWPVVSTEDGNFYYLDFNEDLEIKNHPKEETYLGWTKLYDNLDYDDFDTY